MPSEGSRLRPFLDMLRVVLAKGLSMGSLFLCGVLVARASGPAEFGLYSAALSLVLLLDGVVGSPFDIAAVRFGSAHADDRGRVERILGDTFRAKMLIGLALLLVALPLAEPIAGLLFSDPAESDIVVTALASALGLLALRGTAVALQVQNRFAEYARLDLLVAAGRILLVGLLFAFGVANAVPYLGTYGGMAAAVFLLAFVTIPQPSLRSGGAKPRDRRAMAGFAGITAATGMLGTLSGRADVLVLSSLRPPDEVGMYGAGLQMAMVLSMVAGYAGVVLHPRIVPMAKSGRGWQLLLSALGGGTVVGATAAGIGIWLAPWVIGLVFGPSYTPAIELLQVLLLGAGVDFLGLPVMMHMVVQLFPRQAFIAEVVTFAFFIVAAPWAAGNYGALGVAWLGLAVRLVKLVVYLIVLARNLGQVASEKAASAGV